MQVTHGPPGQIRSDKKVSGTITIAWEWETNTEDLVVEKWIPLLQKLTYGEEKSLPFLGQDDLTPYMPLTVCLYLLGQIALGNVSFPENCKVNYYWILQYLLCPSLTLLFFHSVFFQPYMAYTNIVNIFMFQKYRMIIIISEPWQHTSTMK